uniref:Uncharacterized protein n=1 Tax=Aegilops tauschii subsp. strangulata TaxID=200361 RepID=A0A453M2W6_AEGTS
MCLGIQSGDGIARSHRLCKVASHSIRLIAMCLRNCSTTSTCSRIHNKINS